VIDTPAGSRNKYKYDTGLGAFCISRRLPAGLCFPHDFGFIPQTCAEDGDALDVVVLDLEPGTLGPARRPLKGALPDGEFAVRWLNATAQVSVGA
jgi:inorganic pyrophosphatase